MPSGCTSLPESPAARCSVCRAKRIFRHASSSSGAASDPPRLLQEPAFLGRLSQKTNSKLFCQSKLRESHPAPSATTLPEQPWPMSPPPLSEHWQGTPHYLLCSKESDLLPGGKLEALENPPTVHSQQESPNPGSQGRGGPPCGAGEGRKGRFCWVSTSVQKPHQKLFRPAWLSAPTALLGMARRCQETQLLRGRGCRRCRGRSGAVPEGRGKRLQPSSPRAPRWPVAEGAGGPRGRWRAERGAAASGSQPSPSVGVRPDVSLCSRPEAAGRGEQLQPSRRSADRASALGRGVQPPFPPRGRKLRRRTRGKAAAPAAAGWPIPNPAPLPLPLGGGESARAAEVASLAPTCGPGTRLGSSSSLEPSRSGSAGASGGPAPAPASRLGGGGGSGAWGFCGPAARARSRLPAPPLALLRLRVMLPLAPLPRSTRRAAAAAAATAPLTGQQPIWRPRLQAVQGGSVP